MREIYANSVRQGSNEYAVMYVQSGQTDTEMKFVLNRHTGI